MWPAACVMWLTGIMRFIAAWVHNCRLYIALHGEVFFFMAGFFSSLMFLSLFLNKKHYLLSGFFKYKAEAWKQWNQSTCFKTNQPVLNLKNKRKKVTTNMHCHAGATCIAELWLPSDLFFFFVFALPPSVSWENLSRASQSRTPCVCYVWSDLSDICSKPLQIGTKPGYVNRELADTCKLKLSSKALICIIFWFDKYSVSNTMDQLSFDLNDTSTSKNIGGRGHTFQAKHHLC